MKKYLFLLFATTALIFSCQSEEVTPDNQVDNGPEVAFGINGASLDVVTTKAATDITTQGAAIGLYRLEDTTAKYEADNNNEFYYDAGTGAGGTQENPGWYPKSTPPETQDDNIYLNNNNATICAYYPYASDAAPTITATSIKFALTPEKYDLSTEPDLSNDLCFQKTPITDANNQSASKAITLNHAYSRITFVFTRDASYTGTGALTSISMGGLETTSTKKLINISANVDIAVSANWYTDHVIATGAAPLTFGSLTETLPAHDVLEDDKLKLSYLMVPAAVTPVAEDNVEFVFTIDDTPLKTTLTGTGVEELALLADNNYVVNVTIKGNDLEITKVSCEEWTNVPITDPLDPQYEPDV